MTDSIPEIIYPEMLEYAWVKDLDRVTAASKYVAPDPNAVPVTADKLPKTPVNLLLAIIRESIAYPEVVSALTKGSDTQRSLHLLMWFNEYLLHKYGDIHHGRMVASRFVRRIANGQYSGINDPDLIGDLLESQFVALDDGKNYDQPLAGRMND